MFEVDPNFRTTDAVLLDREFDAFRSAAAVHFRGRLAIERTVLSLVSVESEVASEPLMEIGSSGVWVQPVARPGDSDGCGLLAPHVVLAIAASDNLSQGGRLKAASRG